MHGVPGVPDQLADDCRASPAVCPLTSDEIYLALTAESDVEGDGRARMVRWLSAGLGGDSVGIQDGDLAAAESQQASVGVLTKHLCCGFP
jgi:hypothetical protein